MLLVDHHHVGFMSQIFQKDYFSDQVAKKKSEIALREQNEPGRVVNNYRSTKTPLGIQYEELV